jgi:hypothetical protein
MNWIHNIRNYLTHDKNLAYDIYEDVYGLITVKSLIDMIQYNIKQYKILNLI